MVPKGGDLKTAHIFLLLLAFIFAGGSTMTEAGPGKNDPLLTNPAPSQADAREPSAPQPSIVLEPFYLIQKRRDKVWIERVILTVRLDPSHASLDELNHPHQRGLIYEIIVSDPEQDALPARVQAALNQASGAPVITSVHLSRSFLLF